MNKKPFRFTIEPWTVQQENKEYETPIFKLLKRSMQLQAEDETNKGDFYVLKAPEWINIIPITKDGKVILVEQYRYGIEAPTLEIPGGMVDPGETPKEAASRELLEETGYNSIQWKSLGKVSANPAIMNNFTHAYLAKNCVFKGAQNPDEHERIKVHLLPEEKFLSRVADGTIHHSICVAAVARYLLRRRQTDSIN